MRRLNPSIPPNPPPPSPFLSLTAIAMAMADEEEASKDHWEDLLRRMLPAGAPLPDQDQLDYSISVEYQPSTHPHPSVSPIPNFTKPPKIPQYNHKYTSPTTNFPPSAVTLVSDESFEEEEEEDERDDDGGDKNDGLSTSATTSSPDQNQTHNQNQNQNQNEDENENQNRDQNQKKKKKKLCSRCGKRKRLREKEGCMVCDARYCGNCLLKAMGSMPEGRKCVGCIGKPIHESKRERLGKCSRLLSKVCSPLEVRQIMAAEKECSANQLRPEQVVVNGGQLGQDDLGELLGCPHPPLKLKPGRYWYDKDSGLWGEEGEKPDKIISSKLNVGGKLQVDASNGNTQVYVNGRQITKLELRVLKLSKVQCPQGTHFWLYDDGSYEEEGQNNIKGNIWAKASTRFICSLFCLPVPREHSHGSDHDPSTFLSGSKPQNFEHSRVQKLMLFGLERSGTSTIFKQVRFLYGDKFTAEEMQNLKLIIQSNMYRYVSILLEGRERFEDEALEQKKSDLGNQESVQGGSKRDEGSRCVYSFNPKFKHFSDWLLDIMATGDFDNYFPAATREYAPLVDQIWKDPAIQETYKRRDELPFLPDVARYFLDLAIEISSNDYEPSKMDILYAEGVTPSNGLSYLNFSFNDQSPMSEMHDENGQSPLVKYELIRVSTKGKLYDDCKWLGMFEDARVVVFCVALSDYDQTWSNPNGIMENKMLAHRDSFESLARQPCFANVPFVLVLNKYDLFEEKLSETPLTVCEWFGDFGPVKPHHNPQTLANQAYYYVAMKFKELYGSISGRKLFVWQGMGRDGGCVEELVKYIREVIRWDEERDEDVYGMNMDEDGDGDDSFFTTQT